MLMIAIVDDEKKDAETLGHQVENYFSQHGIAHVIHIYHDGTELIRSPIEHDIVFMDIRMEKLDGLEVARFLRKINKDFILIFVTYLTQYAIKGYEVDALDYILKPADQSAINYVLDKAMKRMDSTVNTIFALKMPGGTASVASNDITYVEVFDHNLVYHTVKGDYNVRGRLADVMGKLDPQRFIMCNRSFIVNLRYVSSVSNDSLMIGTTQISISKSHRKEIMKRFSDFLGDNL